MVKFNKKNMPLSAFWVSRNDKLSMFYLSWWQRGESAVPTLVVRALLAAAALAILTWSVAEGASPYWLIYLTNWGVALVAATTLSGLAVSAMFTSHKPKESSELPWLVSLYWLLFNISVSLSAMITALYWTLLYNPELEVEPRLLWLDIATHGLTSCVMLTELLSSCTPVRLAHMYQPLAFGLSYAAFSGIYYAAGGTDSKGNRYIYEVLDWSNSTQSAIVVVGSVAALVGLYLLLWLIAFGRDKLAAALAHSRRRPELPGHVV